MPTNNAQVVWLVCNIGLLLWWLLWWFLKLIIKAEDAIWVWFKTKHRIVKKDPNRLPEVWVQVRDISEAKERRIREGKAKKLKKEAKSERKEKGRRGEGKWVYLLSSLVKKWGFCFVVFM